MTRTAAEIGAGLAPARGARAIAPGERIHVVGIAGAGASAAALLAHSAGAVVSGCDPGGPSPYTPPLEAAGIPLAWAHDAAHVTGTPPPSRLAVTKALTAVAPDHPELRAAAALGIPAEPWQQVVADAAEGRRLLAVAGTHGKSTTTGWLVHVLAAAGLDPSAFVGALLPAALTGGLPATARIGHGDPFIVEADEYAGNFDPYRPAVAVLTSAEWDHPDVFADRAAVVATFARWIGRFPDGASLVANVADPGVVEVLDAVRDQAVRIVATALLDADVRPDEIGRSLAQRHRAPAGPAAVVLGRITEANALGTTLELWGLDPQAAVSTVRLPTYGRHNAANALGVAGAARAMGADPEAILAGLASFPGIGRRLERKGEAAGVVVYDDYGHHPTAVRATIAALRQREPDRRLWAVYEPLTFHRTAALLDEFAEVLGGADGVVIADIWAGRDPDTSIASAAQLADAVRRRWPGILVAAPGSVDTTAGWLATQVRPGDAVLVMGGGHSYRIGERLLAILEAGGSR